jgi:hypothetical protein
MLNEKPSNDFHWKSKLEEIESLPGETFNKETAWEKLHERIQEKSGTTNAVWYWAAAACLLLALIIPWLFLANKKESVLVKNNPVQKQIPSPGSRLQPGNKDTSVVISLQPTEKKPPAFYVEKSNKITSLARHIVIPSKIIQDKKEKGEFITQIITINAAIPVDTAISIVANLPGKKKLRVVHINDLGDPVSEPPNITRYYERRSLVKFINREVSTSLPSSGNTGFNIFKTKPLPSN